MTSSGVFPNTLVAPAMAPKTPVTRGLMFLLGSSPGFLKQTPSFYQPNINQMHHVRNSTFKHVQHRPLYQFLKEVITKKRMAWLDPCFNTVAVSPWYVPLIPIRNTVKGTRLQSHTTFHYRLQASLGTMNCLFLCLSKS